jgi:hypothetical protein
MEMVREERGEGERGRAEPRAQSSEGGEIRRGETREARPLRWGEAVQQSRPLRWGAAAR